MPISRAAPTTNPMAVPASARRAVDPVAAALVRSTDKVPRTTQKPCWTPLRSATATAMARATEPRRALRNQTDRMLACRAKNPVTLVSAGSPPPPSASLARPSQRRRSAAISSGLARPLAMSASRMAARAATAMTWACAALAASTRS